MYSEEEIKVIQRRSTELLLEMNRRHKYSTDYSTVWNCESDLFNFVGQVMAEVSLEGSYSIGSKHEPGSWRKETVENQVDHAYEHLVIPHAWIGSDIGPSDPDMERIKEDLRHALWRIGAALYLLEYGVEPNG